MPTIDELPAPLNAFFAAFQKGDMDALRTLYHDDAELRDPGVGFLLGHNDLTAKGVDAIMRYYYQSFSNMPQAPVVQLAAVWTSGDDVMVEYTEGMLTYLEVFTLRDGRIAKQKVFWGSIPPAPLLQSRQHSH